MTPLLKILQCLPISLRIEATRENYKVLDDSLHSSLLFLTSVPIILSIINYPSAILLTKPDTLPLSGQGQFTCFLYLENSPPRYQRRQLPALLHTITQISFSQCLLCLCLQPWATAFLYSYSPLPLFIFFLYF